MQQKQDPFKQISLFDSLMEVERSTLLELVEQYRFSFQQRKQLCDIAADLYAWGGDDIATVSRDAIESIKEQDKPHPGKLSTDIFSSIRNEWERQREGLKSYTGFTPEKATGKAPSTEWVEPKGKILGSCPVASEKTRCCNLMTLDAVWQCGFDCSYCSIQSFYYGNKVRFVKELKQRLEELELEPGRRYHIGTGQSSDSLMWGNRHGLLEDLSQFAQDHPNVILEMKSKSDRVEWFRDHKAPKNMLFTWSLNPQPLVEAEERGTVSVSRRLAAAREMADSGSPVGFHFHPVIHYDRWKEDYRELVGQLTSDFTPEEVMTISFGTLTYIKPVIKKVRSRLIKSKILQMPMEEIGGKLSYPYELKREMFSTIYSFFPQQWRDRVYYYFCMEDPALWDQVFGFHYESNEDFEQGMLDHYFSFVEERRKADLS